MSRKIVLVIVLIAIAFSGLGIFGYYWYQGSHYVATDDAMLCGNQIAVSSEIIGRIAIMTVAEGDKVTKGQILAKLDDALLMAQVNQAKANKDYATQNVILAKVKLDQAQSDFNRATSLFQDKVITQEQDDHQKHTLASAQAGLDIALSQEKLATTQISTLETSLAHATIVSPVDGVVAKKWAMPGNVIQPAQSIYTLYDLPNIWIQANFKESQIQYLKVGNPAIISIDVCSGSTFNGKVESMGVAAASQFSLLPADNMGGNFIKVTQRVPVKISIDNHNGLLNEKDGPQLLPGTSVEVRVKIRKG